MSKNVFEYRLCIGKGMFLNIDLAQARAIIQKSFTFDSGKFIDFIKTFDPC